MLFNDRRDLLQILKELRDRLQIGEKNVAKEYCIEIDDERNLAVANQ